MALYPLKTIVPCIAYNPWDGITHTPSYNQYLITKPRVYDEAIVTIGHFFYEPGNDILVAYLQLNIYDWPGWAVYLYKWSAGSGEFLGRQAANIYAISWTGNAGVGSYNQIYACMKNGTQIYSVPWDSLLVSAGMWSIDPHSWNPPSIYGAVVVNREDNLIAGVNNLNLDIWNLYPTPTRRTQMILPDPLGNLAYESRECLWAITRGGLIGKINYPAARWEMLSSVQDPSADAINYFSAFDIRRNRLAVLRQRPDATDGACQCQLEFYRPLYRVALLTDPVPVSRLQAGGRVRFVAHLIGDTGEGVAGYQINAALQAPEGGQVLTPVARTEVCGAASFGYTAPEAGEDTLQLSATITDGQDA
jgi:hypothetical protein